MHSERPEPDPQERARIVARAVRPLAPDVHRVLVAQNARLTPSVAREAHLAALASGAAAVVTGQQVGLFLGPLYTLYKAASAIVLARLLAAETGHPVVPVFWLQTEDHDLPEIASCEIAAGAACEQLAVPVDAASRISIAHLTLPTEVDAAVTRLGELLGDGPDARAHVARVRRHYRAGVPWAEAFAGLLGELFADEGLVVIDPRDATLASVVAPVHARALDDAERIAGVLGARRDELLRHGHAAPVHVRPGSPLSFFHPDGATGPRVRLDPAGPGQLVEVGGEREYERRALLAALAADPQQFSTSALLRPIVQDRLLPTCAYVGGPAEVAYFAQLRPLYGLFDGTEPLIVERAHLRIVDQRSRRVLARLGLHAGDLEGHAEAELLARLRPTDTTGVADRLLQPFRAAHAEVSSELAARGPAVARALARTRGSVEHSVQRFAARLARIAAYEDAKLVEALARARAWLAPDGDLQERRLGLPCFAARLGDRHLVERVLATITGAPFEASMQELS